jgi:K(+)-stimulated pyrophosphate-energized sodium pump
VLTLAATWSVRLKQAFPEDDPRNPATIADNVGDNVGDCAGMAADLFETYAVTVVATMVLASIFFVGAEGEKMMLLPLVIGGAALSPRSSALSSFASVPTTPSWARSTRVSGVQRSCRSLRSPPSSGAGWAPITTFTTTGGTSFTGVDLFFCGVIGLVVTGGIIVVTEYYTGVGYRPVRSISQASVTGHGTNVIQGLAISLEATALPALIIIAGIISTFLLAGLFGIAIAVTTMLALAGIVVALDAFGPVTDNAGGIAEMADLPSSVRETTDALDAVGNTTKAVTKGYAIGSAGLGCPGAVCRLHRRPEVLRSQRTPGSFFEGVAVDFSLSNPYVVVGLLFGGLLPYLFGGMSMTAVGRAGGAVVEEVRRQFKADPGIMEGTSKPDYARAVDMLTKAAIKEMIVPSMLPVLSPIVCSSSSTRSLARTRPLPRWRDAARRDRQRALCGCFDDCRWRCMGQRQEEL